MKKISFIICILTFFAACKKDFLDVQPTSVVTLDGLENNSGVQKLIVGAYHDVTGLTIHSSWWSTTGVNWVYGDITSGDCYRGGTNDGADGIIIEHFQTQPSTGYVADKWRSDYDGVSRANTIIVAANAATDMTDDQKTIAIAQARFLRGHFHFDAKKMWNNVPYIGDSIAGDAVKNGDAIFHTISNTKDIWPNIEADFLYAYNNLPEKMPLKGEANKWAAACYLAKCYMFEHKYTDAKTLLDAIIPVAYGGHGDGQNSQGVSYALNANL